MILTPNNAADAATERASSVPAWLAGLIVTVVALAAFWPIVRSEFSFWDDEETIARNPDFDPPTWAGLGRRWSTPHMHIYIPLTHTLWHGLAWLGYDDVPRSNGMKIDPLPFKVASIGLHLATSLIVLAILRRLFGRGWIAVAGAVLFCAHPLQVESVGWTSGQKDLLFGCLAAACVLVYIGDPRHGFALSTARIAGSLALLTLAALSKPTAIVVPVMLVVLDLCVLRRPWKESAARLLPYVIIAVVVGAYARFTQPSQAVPTNVPLIERPLVMGYTYAFYLVKLFAPVRLAFDYGLNPRYIMQQPIVWIAWLLPAGVAVVAWLGRRRFPLLPIGLLLAAVPIGPVSGLVTFDFERYSVVADHYVYLAMFGVAVAACSLLERVRSARVGVAASSAVVCVLIVLSMRQSLTWTSGRSVTEQTLRVNPRSFASWSNMALLALRQSPSDLDAAGRHVRHAMELAGTDPGLLYQSAIISRLRGDDARAIELMEQAVAMAPREYRFHAELGDLYGHADRAEEALAQYELVLRDAPGHRTALDLTERLRKYVRYRQTTRPSRGPATPVAR